MVGDPGGPAAHSAEPTTIGDATTSPRAVDRWSGWAARTGVAALGGLALWAANPPRNGWYFAVVAMALLFAALHVGSPRIRTGAWVGFVFGLGYFVPLLPWVGEYVGPLPWLALATILAGYLAIFGVLAVVTMRLALPALWFALAWVLVEAVRSMFPFGGFPWGKVAFTQVEGPILPLASILGAPGVSAAVALFGAALAWLIQMLIERARGGAAAGVDGPSLVRPAAVAVILALVGPMAAIAATPSSLDRNVAGNSIEVAAVQGNVPRLGLDFNAQRRAVLDNHVAETRRLGAAIDSGMAKQPDLVAWPENASDISPLSNPDAAEQINAAAHAVHAPMLVGTLDVAGEQPTNTVLVWDEQNGPVDRYDKQIIQPFGEYLPWRSFFRLFSSYADRAGNFRPGSGPSVVTVPARSGEVTVGVATCWEVAFDRGARNAVRDGAQILYVPTNNATFGRTEMTYQQLSMSQVRAVEHGRSVIVAATSGVSALVEPDGSVSQQSEIFTPAVLQGRMALHDDQTLATRLGAWPEAVMMAAAIVGFLVALLRRTRFTGATRKNAVASSRTEGVR